MHREENSFDFNLFFDSLTQEEQQYVSRLALEQDKLVNERDFAQLLKQLYRKNWKTIVHQMKEHLSQAKEEGNTKKVESILTNFQKLKKQMLPTISQK